MVESMDVLKTLTRVLPPPSFIELPSAGVDISDTSLKYIQFAPDNWSGTKLELKHWGDIEIPVGALHRGEVNDQARLTEAIREMKARTGISNVRVSLPEERAYLFQTEIKRGTPFKEIRGLLEFRLEENVPLSPRDAFFDYDIIEGVTEGDTLLVSVTAYAKETIMKYYESCTAAGVLPISFEVEAQAIARAATLSHDANTYMIVDFGKTRTGVGIVHRSVLMYTSTIDIGGADLSKAMREVLGDRPEDELTEIKNTRGLVPGIENKTATEAMLPVVSSIVSELRTRIQYWNSRRTESNHEIKAIILCGGSVNMKGLPEYLTENLGVEAKRADVWQNAFSIDEHVPPIAKRYSYGYATAIGLALAPFM
jgi:type IV pilus assembly protein PilM